jgi:hypothetical protein
MPTDDALKKEHTKEVLTEPALLKLPAAPAVVFAFLCAAVHAGEARSDGIPFM